MKCIKLTLLAFSVFLLACKKDKKTEKPTPSAICVAPTSDILGFSILNKLPGIWNGPVTSTTALGGYTEWIVDFRPIAENQISSKNELDVMNDIHMSFFTARYNNENRIAFRNGGKFGGNSRVSYFLVDSVAESATYNYYRFSEIKKGKSRAYTTVEFKSDSLIMKTYTNIYNTQTVATPHMSWKAKLKNSTAAATSITQYSFPKKTITKDFSSTFIGVLEAIYFDLNGDPYPESFQPHLGKSTINYNFVPTLVPDPLKKVLLMITTQPLFAGAVVNLSNLDTRSRYVLLSSSDLNFDFNYMHLGTYYLYACYDNDANGTINSGDWMSFSNTIFTLDPITTVTASTTINFIIP
jgi:hypothetical protein